MNAQKANLINAVTLIITSIWAYVNATQPSAHDFLPLIFGVIFLSLNNGVLYNNKGQVKAATVLTGVIIILLLLPLSRAIERDKNLEILRLSIMILTSGISMAYLMKCIFKPKDK